jgi:hypothetical protein
VSDEQIEWSDLAARVVRVVLARKNVGYSQLAERLSAFGITEGEKALASRVSLGRVRLSLLLQILQVTDSEVPALWKAALSLAGTWEQRASAVVLSEIEQIPPVGIEELAQRLVLLEAGFTAKTLAAQISSGTLSLPVFLRCLVTLRSSSLDFCIDYKDLVAAARPMTKASE